LEYKKTWNLETQSAGQDMNFQDICSSSALIPSNLPSVSTKTMTSSRFGFNIILLATVFPALAIIRANFICNLLGHRFVESATILNLCNQTGQVDCQTLLPEDVSSFWGYSYKQVTLVT
jgi:hypothetical protein